MSNDLTGEGLESQSSHDALLISALKEMGQYLFVYGSLKQGRGGKEASRMAQQLRYIGKAQVPGTLYDLGDYAGAIVDTNEESFVIGELVELVDSSVLKQLDEYEQYDPHRSRSCLFVRRKVRASLQNGKTVAAWIYVYNRDPGEAPIIASGEY